MQKNTHILFLDFDGVLHPDAAYFGRQGLVLKAEGVLFMWAPILAEILDEFPMVSLVLSTSWVRHLGHKRAVRYLPQELQERVIGATWHSSMANTWVDETQWDGSTRYNQICRYAARAKLQKWIALDDDGQGWAESSLGHLVACNPALGLGSSHTQNELKSRLREMCF
ncbi:HAD domain-containing protein [Pseudomonas sp. Sample_14]|uniref:HAD domain-containing protein n=1 Tax=Pseudomonas sp. Sample_14 TaxID=2448262 RepID=UPI001032C981|nr:HAD domain-containing protein [Pseudomonas sp. Sample_14]